MGSSSGHCLHCSVELRPVSVQHTKPALETLQSRQLGADSKQEAGLCGTSSDLACMGPSLSQAPGKQPQHESWFPYST
jgi:hypothetical protein